MNRYVMLVVVWAVVTPTHAEESGSNHLQPLAFLAGSCWHGEFPGGQSSDTHCFDWVYDGQHLRDTHVVTQVAGQVGKEEEKPYRGETIYSWDAENKRIAFRYWNSLGGFSDGFFEIEDGVLSVPERYTGKDGDIIEMRSTLEPVDADHYVARTYRRIDDDWREDWTVNFTRTDDEYLMTQVCGMAPR